MSAPIPLISPDGRIYAHACGVCHEVGGMPSRIRREGDAPETGPDEGLIEHQREMAADCCTCRKCGKVGCGISIECTACAAKSQAERDAKRPEQLADNARRTAIFDAALATALDPVAAVSLRDELEDLSESYICSSWDEFAIEQARLYVIGGNGDDLGGVLSNYLSAIRSFAGRAGGWWAWSTEAQRPVFVKDGAA